MPQTTARQEPSVPVSVPTQAVVSPTQTGASTFDRPATPLSTRGAVRDPVVGVRDPVVGVRDPIVDVRDPVVGVRDLVVGVRDPVVELLGPERTAYEMAVKSTLEKYLEAPSYLRDDAPQSAPTHSTAAVNGLAEDLRVVLLPMVAQPDSKSAKVVENVVGSNLWKDLSTPDQHNLAKVMASAGERGLAALAALLEGTPGAATSLDSNGKSLVENLAELASAPLNVALYAGTTKQRVLDEVLLQVANPNRVEQGNAPTCTVTSMQFELVRDDASEYVRLMAGLTGVTGKVEMKGGGDLKLEPAALAQLNERQSSHAIFQSAAMEYGNGSHDVEPAQDAYPGLLPYQQTEMLRQLFGVKYETNSLPTETSRATALDELRNTTTAGNNRPVLLEIDQGNFNHAVTYEMQKNDRVYFRDPFGQIRSMPQDAFIKHVVAVHKPQVMPG